MMVITLEVIKKESKVLFYKEKAKQSIEELENAEPVYKEPKYSPNDWSADFKDLAKKMYCIIEVKGYYFQDSGISDRVIINYDGRILFEENDEAIFNEDDKEFKHTNPNYDKKDLYEILAENNIDEEYDDIPF